MFTKVYLVVNCYSLLSKTHHHQRSDWFKFDLIKHLHPSLHYCYLFLHLEAVVEELR